MNHQLEIEGYCRLWGENFSPKKAEETTGTKLDRKNEPGAVGQIGRYKGIPIPSGHAEIDFVEGGTSADLLSPDASILELLEKHLPSFRAAGATEVTLHVNIFYKEQCNLEQSPELIRRLARLGIALTVSCQMIE